MRGPLGAPAVRWLALAGPAPDAIAAALLGLPGAEAKLEPVVGGAPGGGREAMRARLGSGEELFVVRFAARPPRRSGGDALARRVHRDEARREWRMLRRLAAAGAPVPEPRALGRVRGGDLVLVTRYQPGPTLAAALAAGARGRELAESVGAALARLHAAGYVHGELRAENVILAEPGALFVGVRSARRSRSRAARRRDAAALEHSIGRRLGLVDRVRLRAAALGLHRPFDAAARGALRSVARLARARGVERARARMRRAGRPGEGRAIARVAALRGLRDPALAPDELAAALAAPPGLARARRRVRFSRAGGRRLVVKEFEASLFGALGDLVRGSPARRAWLAGHGLGALGIGAARPLAFLERRRFGLVFGSALVQEDLCPAIAADSPGPGARAAEHVDALVDLALAMHAAGALHRDFTAANVLLAREGRALRARLVDLEDARVPRRLGDAARARALAEMNASLPDWIPDALRRRAFRRYATWLPFRAPRARVLARLVAASLAREHHWSGRGCRLARGRRSEAPESGGRRAVRQDAEIVTQRKELEEPGMRPPLPGS